MKHILTYCPYISASAFKRQCSVIKIIKNIQKLIAVNFFLMGLGMRFELPLPDTPITLQEVQNLFYYATNDQVVRWVALRDMIPRLDRPPECCRERTLTFGTTSADGAVWRCPVCCRNKFVRGDCCFAILSSPPARRRFCSPIGSMEEVAQAQPLIAVSAL